MSGLRLTFLGSGASYGVPIIGCRCRGCTSEDPRDHRLRASVWLEWEGASVLVDSGPDFRNQALNAGISRLDAVWYTHAHADHIGGIDDLRPFTFGGGTLPVRAHPRTLEELRHRYDYAFREAPDPSGVSTPQLRGLPIEGAFVEKGREVVPLPVSHGRAAVLGFRVGRLAYLTDVGVMPDSTLALLGGLDTLVLSALREEPHPTHLNFRQAIELARTIGARRTVFTHIAHDHRHREIEARLPEGIEPAWDGLVLEVGGA